MCSDCARPVAACVCRQKKGVPKGGGIVRKGNGVKVITGVPLDTAELKELAKRLKAMCGVGGSVHGDVLLKELKMHALAVRLACA